MGNQSGTNKPPEFIGKSWSYVTEKKRKSAIVKRPNSTMNLSSDAYVSSKTINDDDNRPNSDELRCHRGNSEPLDQIALQVDNRPKRKTSIKSGRTLRSSPTVPEALTLSLDLASAGIGVGLSAMAKVDQEAVANALNALRKLTPAAPRLFKEPVFDEFFEEAERRNLTMEALQAAMIGPRTSSTSHAEDDEVEENLASSSSYVGHTKENANESKRSQTKSLIATGGHRSKDTLHVMSYTTEDDSVFNCTSDKTYPQAADSEGVSSKSTKGKLLVILASGVPVNGDSEEVQHWDSFPPTLIVQPQSKGLFSSSCPHSNTAMSMPTVSPSPRLNEIRRGSTNLSSTSPSSRGSTDASGGVRFADQASPTWFSEEEAACHRSGSHGEYARNKRRGSLRRKTIAGVAHPDLLLADGATMSAPDISSESPTATTAAASNTVSPVKPLALSHIVHRSDEQRPASSQPSLRKKSLSKSDLLCPPPIITLLKQPQMNLIRQLWQQLYNTKGATVLGNHIFQRVFFKNPQIKEVFRNVDVGNQHVNVDYMCKAHAKAVASILDEVVKNLENLREVESKLTEIGKKHAVFYDLGFHINFWSVFAEAFIDCTLEWGEKNRRVEESRKAWAIIIAYITDKMKLGFQEARRNLPRGGRRLRHSEGSDGGSAGPGSSAN